MLDTDEDYRIELDHNSANPINVDIAKAQLVPGTAKSFTFAESRPDLGNENARVTFVTVTLSTNERQLAVAIGGTDDTNWSITGIFAR